MLNRRQTMFFISGAALTPTAAFAATPLVIEWEDLIPEGLPYSKIIGDGERNVQNDTWSPVYDANGTKLNEDLNGVLVKMPGFIVPFDMSAAGVSNFMLVPYVGACIHTPPPPANQLVLVNAAEPWPGDEIWAPVWVIGTLSTQLQSTRLGQTGYSIAAQKIEKYVW